MTKRRGINKPRTFWTEQQIAMLHRSYPDNRTEDIVWRTEIFLKKGLTVFRLTARL